MISSAKWWAMIRARFVGRGFVVLFAEHLRRLLILDVVKPALHRHLPAAAPRLPKASMAALAAADSRRQN